MHVFPLTKITAVLTAALLLSSCGAGNVSAESSRFVFDTYASFKISGSGSAEILENLTEHLQTVSDTFDLCYDLPAAELPDSGIYDHCLSQSLVLTETYGRGVSMTCGALTSLWGISDGDYHIPDEDEIRSALRTVSDDGTLADGTWLDFGAAAKGYACDEAYAMLTGTETEYAVISLGSSTLLYGQKPDGKFRAGITHPDGDGYLGIIETDAAFVSTSGGYERYFEADGQRFSHILDLETGRPAETDLVSVTVIVPASAENGGFLSDWLSTMIYIGGTAELDRWLAYEEFSVVAADETGSIRTDFDGFIPDGNSGFTFKS